MATIGKDKTKEQKTEKKKMRKAAVKGVATSIKSTLFPGKDARKIRKEDRQEKRAIAKEFGFKKGGSVKIKKK